MGGRDAAVSQWELGDRLGGVESGGCGLLVRRKEVLSFREPCFKASVQPLQYSPMRQAFLTAATGGGGGGFGALGDGVGAEV